RLAKHPAAAELTAMTSSRSQTRTHRSMACTIAGPPWRPVGERRIARSALEAGATLRPAARGFFPRHPLIRPPEVRMLVWFVMGLLAWLVLRFVVRGVYTIGPNERAVITTFGRAQRVGTATTLDDPVAHMLSPEEAERYVYPQVRVIGPGVHRKLPWQKV